MAEVDLEARERENDRLMDLIAGGGFGSVCACGRDWATQDPCGECGEFKSECRAMRREAKQ